MMTLAEGFDGHEPRECGEHRTVRGRAWCFDCSEWCYPHAPCVRCELPALRDAARRWVTALENGRDVWWCIEHYAPSVWFDGSRPILDREPFCFAFDLIDHDTPDQRPCRIVGAVVILKEDEGATWKEDEGATRWTTLRWWPVRSRRTGVTKVGGITSIQSWRRL